MKKALPTISIVGHLKRFYYGPPAQNRNTLDVRLLPGQYRSNKGNTDLIKNWDNAEIKISLVQRQVMGPSH